VLFFLSFFALFNRVLNGAWCFSDDRFNRCFFSDRGRSCLGHFSCRGWFGSNRSCSGGQFGFLLQTLGFTLATTHFTRVVWRAAVWRQGADGSRRFNHWRWRFDCGWCFFNLSFGNRSFNHWCRRRLCCCNYWLGNHSLRHFGFSDWRWSFGHSWFGNPVERSLLFANFTHGFGHVFADGFGCWFGFSNWRFDDSFRFGSCFSLRLSFADRSDFDFRCSSHFHWSGGFDNRRFDWSSFQCGGGGAFSLLVSFGFCRSADGAAGNGGGDGQASGQIGSAWLASVFN